METDYLIQHRIENYRRKHQQVIYIPQKHNHYAIVFAHYLLTLTIGFVETRIFADYTGIPYDYDTPNAIDMTNNYLLFIIHAIVTFKFAYIVCDEYNKLKKWYFYVIYFATIPLFSLISDLNFASSISIDEQSIKYWSVSQWLFICIIVLIVLTLIIYHIVIAYKINTYAQQDLTIQRYSLTKTYCFIYIVSILTFVCLYGFVWIYLVYMLTSVQVHLHHWFLFWLLSLFAQFNTTTSISSLAICLGIFTQGASVYGLAYIY